jgi:hypothetical protein
VDLSTFDVFLADRSEAAESFKAEHKNPGSCRDCTNCGSTGNRRLPKQLAGGPSGKDPE